MEGRRERGREGGNGFPLRSLEREEYLGVSGAGHTQQLNPAQRADTDSDGSFRKRPATQCFGAETWLHFKLEMDNHCPQSSTNGTERRGWNFYEMG